MYTRQQIPGEMRAMPPPREHAAALALPAVTQALAGRQVRRIVFVPNKIINVVG